MQVIVPVMRELDQTELLDNLKCLLSNVKIIGNQNVNRGVIQSYQIGYEQSEDNILAFVHDDVIIHDDDWKERVTKEFDDPKVGVVGFGGATQHGHPDIYKVPYDYRQLARFGYMSNTDDAEKHGKRFTGSCDVAVLDGFALIVRRELLNRVNGWSVDRYPPHHCYDYWICCLAHYYDYKVRLVGISCLHQGGRTATTPKYQEWCRKTKWGSDDDMHKEGHKLIYEDFREVLPWKC